MPNLLSTKQVAEKLGLSQRTITRWTAERKIPFFLLNGIVRFDEQVIDSWIEKKRVRVKQVV